MYLVLPIYMLINFAGLTGSSSVAYEAHLFGLLTGGIIGLYLRKRVDGYGKEKQLSSKKKRRENKRDDTKTRGENSKRDETDEKSEKELDLSNWEKKIKKWEKKYMFD
jgi:hypothetical protein